METGPKESVIVARAIKKLNELPGCLAQKIHGSAWGHQLLDVLACVGGQMFLLEAKRPGKKPTSKQEATMRKWERAGCITGAFTSAEEAVDIVSPFCDKGVADQDRPG